MDIQIDDRVIQARLLVMTEKVRAALRKKNQELAEKLKSKVQQNLTNQILNIRTGKLVRSIFKEAIESENEVAARVYSSGLKYAKIQEFGGTVRHPGGTAYIPGGGSAFAGAAVFISNAKAAALAARFESGDLPRTKPHNITIPGRHYMGTAFDDMKPEIRAGYEQAVKGAVKE